MALLTSTAKHPRLGYSGAREILLSELATFSPEPEPVGTVKLRSSSAVLGVNRAGQFGKMILFVEPGTPSHRFAFRSFVTQHILLVSIYSWSMSCGSFTVTGGSPAR